jgi:hypothetical protein
VAEERRTWVGEKVTDGGMRGSAVFGSNAEGRSERWACVLRERGSLKPPGALSRPLLSAPRVADMLLTGIEGNEEAEGVTYLASLQLPLSKYRSLSC